MYASAPTASGIAPSLQRLPMSAAQQSRGWIHGRAIQEQDGQPLLCGGGDAFTSEGGYLSREVDVPEKDVDADHKALDPSRDFSKAVGRCAAGVRAALTIFRGAGTQRTTLFLKRGSVQTLHPVPLNIAGAKSSIVPSQKEPS